MEEQASVQNFNVVTIWKKQADGSWKCAVDVMSPETLAQK